jgi:hypothetical protein
VARKTARRIWGNPSAKETGKRKKDSETQANSPSRLAMLRPHINDTLPTGSDVGSYSTRKDSELPHINDVANISESQPEDAMIMQQTEDQYVDLDGGGGIDDGSGVAQSVGLLENVDPRVFLRQEEEESTQDLVAEREVRMALDVGLVGDVADIPDVVSSSEEVSSREEVSQQAEGVMEVRILYLFVSLGDGQNMIASTNICC